MDMFVENLKKIMEEKKISQRKLSELSTLNITTINSLFRRNARNPDLETIRHIAKALNVSESYLMFGTELFDKDYFDEILKKKDIDFSDLVFETRCNPMNLLNSQLPPLNEQDNIADYLKLSRDKVFLPSYKTEDFIRAFQISKKSIATNNIVSKQQFITMFEKLNDDNRKVVYNLACDLLNIQMNKHLKKYNK